MENGKIPKSIDKWKIEYDPYDFIHKENWYLNIENTEDILQLSLINKNLILDFGFYSNFYKIYIIKDYNWDNPIEEFESKNIENILDKIYLFIDKYSTYKLH